MHRILSIPFIGFGDISEEEKVFHALLSIPFIGFFASAAGLSHLPDYTFNSLYRVQGGARNSNGNCILNLSIPFIGFIKVNEIIQSS